MLKAFAFQGCGVAIQEPVQVQEQDQPGTLPARSFRNL